MIIGTAGHIDHGKTALVRALTGVDADRLPEEKRRGITIDLGYAYIDRIGASRPDARVVPGGAAAAAQLMADAGGSDRKGLSPLSTAGAHAAPSAVSCIAEPAAADRIGFVDVPGHERLVHTMLAGASAIDAALLVVALPEGVMPQTREHLRILDLLGIDRGVVALTKADLAPDRIPAVAAAVRALLAGTGLASAPILPVSAVTGAGIAELAAALVEIDPRARPADLLPRLAVDRAFTLTGAGLVVTGTLVSGRIAVDDRLVLSPSDLTLRVRGLHAQNRPAREAVAGQRVALNITGPRLSKASVKRGNWVLHKLIHAPTQSLDARIRLAADEPRPLRPDTPVHLHLGAAHGMARVSPLSGEHLRPGESALVRLTLDQPTGTLAGDRVVLRDAGAGRTIGGGTVLDPFPPRRGGRTSLRLSQLAALEAPGSAEVLRRLVALSPNWVDLAPFFQARAVPEAMRPALVADAGARAIGGLALTGEALAALRRSVTVALAEAHRKAPDLPGLAEDALRRTLPNSLPPSAFGALMEALVKEGAIARNGAALCLPSHRVVLTERDEHLWRRIRPLLATERFRPPRVGDLARAVAVPDKAVTALLRRMQRLGRVSEVAPDHFFLCESLAEMVGIAAAIERESGVLTAASFRDRLDNGRKVAIQILEHFDRVGVTQRDGDLRSLRPDRMGMFGPCEVHAPGASPNAAGATGEDPRVVDRAGNSPGAATDGGAAPIESLVPAAG